IPAGVWLGGMGVVLAWHLAGLWIFARRLSQAQPAPRWAQREVREVARQVGLRREPEALMVSARISPLVLVGPAVRLVLPGALRDVREVARQVGLESEPEARRVSPRISQLVWVGPAVRPLLPPGLRDELDATERRTIPCHELAHMRGGDHWLRWAEILV